MLLRKGDYVTHSNKEVTKQFGHGVISDILNTSCKIIFKTGYSCMVNALDLNPCSKHEYENYNPTIAQDIENIDWSRVESFEFKNETLYPISVTINKSGIKLEAKTKEDTCIWLTGDKIVTNIKYKNNERSIKVPRRDSKVKRNTRIRGVAVSSRASRAKCKRGNF